jgi:hypothetical protein
VKVDGTVPGNFVDPRCELCTAATLKGMDFAGNGKQNIGGNFFGVRLRHIHRKPQKPNQGGSQGVHQLLHGRLRVGSQFLEKLWRIEILKGRRQPLCTSTNWRYRSMRISSFGPRTIAQPLLAVVQRALAQIGKKNVCTERTWVEFCVD